MNKVTISAPGKLMLFGEHAVVYDHPCIATAVNQKMSATVELSDKPDFQLNAQDVKIKDYKKPLSQLGKGEIPKNVKFAEIAVKNFFEKFNLNNGIKIETHSDFSSQMGFGSSSAVTVCIIKALDQLFNTNLTNKEIFDLSYKTVLEVQGKGSGFDIAVSIYGGTIYFQTGGKKIEPLKTPQLPLIVGYSGTKADTVTLMKSVIKKFADNPKRLQEIYNEIETIVKKGKQAIENSNWQQSGQLMNENQKLLEELGVSTPKLNAMIKAALANGAYGAKLSGAGGGDCMIAFVPADKLKSVENAITKTGGKIIDVIN